MLGLVNELLEISHIETNRLELSPEPVLIRELVDDVMDLMLPSAAPIATSRSRPTVLAGPDRFVKAIVFV